MTKGFMSELKGCRHLSLGKTERMFLTFFCLAGDKVEKSYLNEPWFGHGLSAYKMYSELRGTEMSMTYKNVRKRIIRLLDLGLIEEVKEVRRYRRAIKYKATALGLFQRFLTQQENPFSIGVLKTHKDSIILQTILFKYFEYATIEEFRNYHGLSYVTNYLTRCCEAILKAIEHYRQEGHHDLDDAAIHGIVLREAVNLIFDMALLSNKTLQNADEPNVTTLLPIPSLANDKKFMTYLYAIKDELDLGYYKIASLSEIPKVRASAEILAGAGMLDVTGKPLVFKRADDTL